MPFIGETTAFSKCGIRCHLPSGPLWVRPPPGSGRCTSRHRRCLPGRRRTRRRQGQEGGQACLFSGEPQLNPTPAATLPANRGLQIEKPSVREMPDYPHPGIGPHLGAGTGKANAQSRLTGIHHGATL